MAVFRKAMQRTNYLLTGISTKLAAWLHLLSSDLCEYVPSFIMLILLILLNCKFFWRRMIKWGKSVVVVKVVCACVCVLENLFCFRRLLRHFGLQEHKIMLTLFITSIWTKSFILGVCAMYDVRFAQGNGSTFVSRMFHSLFVRLVRLVSLCWMVVVLLFVLPIHLLHFREEKNSHKSLASLGLSRLNAYSLQAMYTRWSQAHGKSDKIDSM